MTVPREYSVLRTATDRHTCIQGAIEWTKAVERVRDTSKLSVRTRQRPHINVLLFAFCRSQCENNNCRAQHKPNRARKGTEEHNVRDRTKEWGEENYSIRMCVHWTQYIAIHVEAIHRFSTPFSCWDRTVGKNAVTAATAGQRRRQQQQKAPSHAQCVCSAKKPAQMEYIYSVCSVCTYAICTHSQHIFIVYNIEVEKW